MKEIDCGQYTLQPPQLLHMEVPLWPHNLVAEISVLELPDYMRTFETVDTCQNLVMAKLMHVLSVLRFLQPATLAVLRCGPMTH
eukprot:921840-Amphidinium_carterae.1